RNRLSIKVGLLCFCSWSASGFATESQYFKLSKEPRHRQTRKNRVLASRVKIGQDAGCRSRTSLYLWCRLVSRFNQPSHSPGAFMKRREMIRTTLFAGAVAAVRPQLAAAQSTATPSELTPAQSGVDGSKDLSAPGWKPLFLDEHQNETLI